MQAVDELTFVHRGTHQATRAGDSLLLESAGCRQCSPETKGHGAAAVELLRMVDIHAGRGTSK